MKAKLEMEISLQRNVLRINTYGRKGIKKDWAKKEGKLYCIYKKSSTNPVKLDDSSELFQTEAKVSSLHNPIPTSHYILAAPWK